MYGLAIAAFAALATAAPTPRPQEVSFAERSILDENLFVCPGEAPYGGCSLEGNPYYVNEAKTGSVIAGTIGVWVCPTTYGLSNITALCCNSLSHDGDYDYSTWCTGARTTALSTAALLAELDPSAPQLGDLGSLESVTQELKLEALEDELKSALKVPDLAELEAIIANATAELDLDTLENEIKAATAELDLSTIKEITDKLEAELKTDSLTEVTDKLESSL